MANAFAIEIHIGLGGKVYVGNLFSGHNVSAYGNKICRLRTGLAGANATGKSKALPRFSAILCVYALYVYA
ncbi:hypothetical protein GCM10025791_28960 [Halioxenophilus aromaticivorans]|uniref:Uncharacterized protein n=1 Tax=Halioxenophilus aromaticivorans TaxID=1306992 RepID=A0AAV3U4F9_9ALTE